MKRLLLCVPAVLSSVAFGACDRTGSKPPPSCDVGIVYSGLDLDAEVKAGNKFGAKVSASQTAIREIRKSVEDYGMQWKTLCHDREADRVTAEYYQNETGKLRTRLDEVNRLRAQLSSATNASEYATAAREFYQAAVPSAQRSGLTAQLRVMAQIPGQSEFEVMPQGAVLSTETMVRFETVVDATAYLYLYQVNSSGELQLLYPDPRMPPNPVQPGVVQLPAEAVGFFKVDDKDLGIEEVHLIASPKAIPSLEAGVFNRAGAQTQDCKTRGLSFSPAGCAPTRGLVLEPKTGERSQVSAAAISYDPNDAIKLVYTFHHVAQQEDYGVKSRGVGNLGFVKSARPSELKGGFPGCLEDGGEKEMPTADGGFEKWCVEDRDGQLVDHGPYRKWFSDGQLMVEGSFDFGRRSGDWTTRDTSGSVVSTTSF